MNTDEQPEYGYNEVPIPRSIRFWLLLCFDIPSIACTLFLLLQILFQKNLRQALHNHVIIVILVIALVSQLIGVLFYMVYAKIGTVWLATSFFCNLWQFIDIGLFNMIGMLLAYSAVERHILIFHNSLVTTKRKRMIFHYIPFGLTVAYGFIFYIFLIFFPPCEVLHDYTQPWCGINCAVNDPVLTAYDGTFNCCFSILVMIFANITLIIRHIRQKYRVHQQIQWRKHRKMILQLFSVSLLLLIFYLPIIILVMKNFIGGPTEFAILIQLYLYFFAYFVILLMPYVCFPSISNNWKIFILAQKKLTHWKNTTQINTTTPITNQHT